ncbi:MAG: M48 family metallopeptidase [Bacteroidota bacterium]
MKTKIIRYGLFLIMAIVGGLMITSCTPQAGGGSGINLFSVDQDKELGAQTAQQIADDPQQFPILPRRGHEEVYQMVENMTNAILSTGKVAYSDQFPYDVKIIDNDTVLNAFATPGGYIYVYTGLIKFLDSEDQLAGVMGHEIAHSARRHSTSQITKVYGISAMLSMVTGNASPSMMEQIATGLAQLSFSRSHETDADNHSVIYLCETGYNAAGAAGFFKKMEGQPTQPAFLSTHPNPGNRVQNIEAKAAELGCTGGNTYTERYNRVKASLR